MNKKGDEMDNIRKHQPVARPQPSAIPPASISRHTQHSRRRFNKKQLAGIVAAIVALLAALTVWQILTDTSQIILKDRYQAVFLEDGKVFFGQLQNTDGQYLTLSNAYYTQSQASAESQQPDQARTQLNLVKVGEEVYGPENSLSIRADQVLFWQNLTSDSQVLEAIKTQGK